MTVKDEWRLRKILIRKFDLKSKIYFIKNLVFCLLKI